jgi:Abnormal spindle-like microcephaly-assoc'd, ASPM-SPD-2-Hydin
MRLPRLASSRLLYCVVALVGFSAPPTALATELKVSAEDLHFGKVIVGQTRSLSATLKNTGASAVQIASIQSSASVFVVSHSKLPFTLKAGQHVALEIRFHPVAVGHTDGRIVFDKTAASLGVHGSGVERASKAPPQRSALRANPSSLTFGNVQVGNSAKLPMVLTNTGASSITISEGRIPSAGFSLVGLSTPLTLEAGQSFTFSIEFAPETASTVSGDLTFVDHKSEAAAIMLRGTGTAAGHLGDAPAAMNFGNVTVGKSASRSGTLSASEGSVRVNSVASSSPEFVVSGISFPVTISAGQSVHYTVNFTPQQSGTASASLSFASSASDSRVSESLTGSGVTAANQYVVLSWNASTSQVAGYNVYRSGQPGGPYAKINSGIDKGTTYKDTSVRPGQTYYYVIAAVNSRGQQSKYSNQAQAAIP